MRNSCIDLVPRCLIHAALLHVLLVFAATGNDSQAPTYDAELTELENQIESGKGNELTIESISLITTKLRGIRKEWGWDSTENMLFTALAYKLRQFGDDVPSEMKTAGIQVLIEKMNSTSNTVIGMQLQNIEGLEDPRLIAAVEKLQNSPYLVVKNAASDFLAKRAEERGEAKDERGRKTSPDRTAPAIPNSSAVPGSSPAIPTESAPVAAATDSTPSLATLWTCAAAAIALLAGLLVFWKRRPS